MQKYLDDQYLFLMIALIATPILVSLTVQVTVFPQKLKHEILNKVRMVPLFYSECVCTYNSFTLG